MPLENITSAMATVSPIPFADRSMIYAGVVIRKRRIWDVFSWLKKIHQENERTLWTDEMKIILTMKNSGAPMLSFTIFQR